MGADDSLEVLKLRERENCDPALNTSPSEVSVAKDYKGGKSVVKSGCLRISTDAQGPASAHVNHCHSSLQSQTAFPLLQALTIAL